MLILFFNVLFISFMNIFGVGILQEEKVYTVSEVAVKPEPENGLTHFHDRWSKQVVYPKEAIAEKIQGIVYVEFIVNKDGTITGAAIRAGIGHGCDEAALKGFKEVSKKAWKPAVKDGLPVNVKMVIPFYFRLIVSN
jgi:protein TonB